MCAKLARSSETNLFFKTFSYQRGWQANSGCACWLDGRSSSKQSNKDNHTRPSPADGLAVPRQGEEHPAEPREALLQLDPRGEADRHPQLRQRQHASSESTAGYPNSCFEPATRNHSTATNGQQGAIREGNWTNARKSGNQVHV